MTPEMFLALFASSTVGTPITDDDVKFHLNDETWITLPKGCTYERAQAILEAKRKEEDTTVAIQRIFKFRPDDGANAAANVLKNRYGITIGKKTETFFGSRPPLLRTINIGYNKTRQVPWELIEILPLKGAEIRLTSTEDADFGPVFAVIVETPKRHQREIENLFDAIAEELATNSIYRGKALVGANELEFLDTSTFDASKIVFSDEVTNTLQNGLFNPIRYSDAFKRDGIPLKKALLLHGPYGTGKSSVGMMTAQVAEANGWTFLMGRTGRDSIKDVLRTAKLYQRCVVFIEDIDTQSSTSKPQEVSELLEVFDGVTAKGAEIILVMTTNHVTRIHTGMMRPGRLDFMVEISTLDRGGIERLIRAVVAPEKLAGDVDFDVVYKEMDGFEPAFVKAVADRAKTWALGRTGGDPDYVLETEDLAGAAMSLHAQLRMLREASEGQPEPELTAALETLLKGSIEGVQVIDNYDDPMFRLAQPEAIGK